MLPSSEVIMTPRCRRPQAHRPHYLVVGGAADAVAEALNGHVNREDSWSQAGGVLWSIIT